MRLNHPALACEALYGGTCRQEQDILLLQLIGFIELRDGFIKSFIDMSLRLRLVAVLSRICVLQQRWTRLKVIYSGVRCNRVKEKYIEPYCWDRCFEAFFRSNIARDDRSPLLTEERLSRRVKIEADRNRRRRRKYMCCTELVDAPCLIRQ